MIEIVNFLLEISEEMLIHLIMYMVPKEIPYFIECIDRSKINPNNPIKYRLSINLNKLNVNKI